MGFDSTDVVWEQPEVRGCFGGVDLFEDLRGFCLTVERKLVPSYGGSNS